MEHVKSAEKSNAFYAFYEYWVKTDKIILSCYFLQILLSIFAILSSGSVASERYGISDDFYFVKKQFIFIALSFLSVFYITNISFENIITYAKIALLLIFLSLLYIFFFETSLNGAGRWISIASIKIQPSEFLKPFFIIVTSHLLSNNSKDNKYDGKFLSFILYVAFSILLLLQPDYGQWSILTAIWLTLFFLSGFDAKWAFAILMFIIFVALYAMFFASHVQDRIKVFLNPEQNYSYQLEQSIYSLKNGGLWGVGPFNGVVKYNLPDAHTDFIFAVLVEELGLVFGCLLIFIYATIFIRSVIVSKRINSIYKKLSLFCLSFIFLLQAMIHISVSIRILPAKGLTLPFLSYGGSSMIASSIIIGLILLIIRDNR